MSMTKAAVFALAASLAVPIPARAAGPTTLEDPAHPKGADPKHAEELKRAQATHEKGTPAPLNDAQRTAIGAVLAANQLEGEAGALAATRGKSQDVKNLGRWLAGDERGISKDLGDLLRARGTDPAKLPPWPDQQRIQGELGALAKTSGDAFDQQLVEFLTRNTPAFKERAGHARDVTPGSDADLKWYLDGVERLEIGHRDAARQLASQRQARTPQQATPRPPGRR